MTTNNLTTWQVYSMYRQLIKYEFKNKRIKNRKIFFSRLKSLRDLHFNNNSTMTHYDMCRIVLLAKMFYDVEFAGNKLLLTTVPFDH